MQVLQLGHVDGLQRVAGLQLGVRERGPPSDFKLLLGDLAGEEIAQQRPVGFACRLREQLDELVLQQESVGPLGSRRWWEWIRIRWSERGQAEHVDNGGSPGDGRRRRAGDDELGKGFLASC